MDGLVKKIVIKNNDGWSLLELMIVLGLISLISLSGFPSLSASIKRSQSQQVSETIIKAFELARQEALSRNNVVTFCGIKNNKCEKRGELALSIFIDDNQNRMIDNEEEVIRVFSNTTKDSQFIFKASLGRAYFRFKENGSAMESGSVIYCPTKENTLHWKVYAQIIKLNYTGRAYLLRDQQEKEKQLSC